MASDEGSFDPEDSAPSLQAQIDSAVMHEKEREKMQEAEREKEREDQRRLQSARLRHATRNSRLKAATVFAVAAMVCGTLLLISHWYFLSQQTRPFDTPDRTPPPDQPHPTPPATPAQRIDEAMQPDPVRDLAFLSRTLDDAIAKEKTSAARADAVKATATALAPLVDTVAKGSKGLGKELSEVKTKLLDGGLEEAKKLIDALIKRYVEADDKTPAKPKTEAGTGTAQSITNNMYCNAPAPQGVASPSPAPAPISPPDKPHHRHPAQSCMDTRHKQP